MINIAEKLNLVIEYIENRLTGEIEQDEIAKIAGFSFKRACATGGFMYNIRV